MFAGEVVVDVEDEVGLLWLEPWEGVGHVDDGQREDEEKQVGSEVQWICHGQRLCSLCLFVSSAWVVLI